MWLTNLALSEWFFLCLSVLLIGLGIIALIRIVREKMQGEVRRNYLVAAGLSILFGVYNFLISLDVV